MQLFVFLSRSFPGKMLLCCLICAPIYALLRWLYCRKRTSAGLRGELLRFAFAMCLVALLSQTLLPYWTITPDGALYIVPPSGGSNLIPFHSIAMYLRVGLHDPLSQMNLLGNVLLFVPLGLLPPLLWRKWRPFPIMLTFSLALPLFIEIEQHFIGRASDVDDILLNALGILLGYAIWLLAHKRRARKRETS